MNTLPKSERLCGKVSVSALMSKGRWGFTSGLKYCFQIPPDGEGTPNRMMVSVPKRLFKRAVRRNLLKRRIREAYRTRKELLPPSGVSVLFLYNTPEILDFQTVTEQVESILRRIGNERQQ
ncbi:MAG: ribonuclease P protein component [Bacteroidales bacterium]|nr:ribonuclease P protein component [Bacteroidales bacterium]